MRLVQPGPSEVMAYPLGPPTQGEDLGSINEPAEIVSTPVGVERVNNEESRGAFGGAVGRSNKYHGKACL